MDACASRWKRWTGIPCTQHLPLCELDQVAGFESKQFQEELHHPTRDAYWEKICYQHRFHEIDLPVMHISGWYDDEQISTPMNFIGMTTRGATEFARKNQKLLMGPWGHAINTTQKMGEVDFGPDSLIDLRGYELRWFDALLKGQDTGILQEPAARLFVMGENKWRDENEYPLARTQFTHYYFHSGGNANSRFGDGALSTEKPTNETPDQYVYDPARPTPYVTAPTSSQIGGPDDYSAVQQRGDLLVYMTPPLEQDTEVIGPVRVELYASSSAVDTDFTALLFDAHPNGFVQRLSDGIVRARYRDGMESSVAHRAETRFIHSRLTCGTPRKCFSKDTASAFKSRPPPFPSSTATSTPANRSPQARGCSKPNKPSITTPSILRRWCCQS